MLETGTHLSALAADSQAFADAATDLDAPIASCPEWTAADLVAHLGGVYSWATQAITAGGERPAGPRAEPPADRAGLIDWFLDWRRTVLDGLTSREPDERAWNFTGREDTFTVGWWRRRQAHETAVHLFDLQAATGTPGTVAPELAADGVDELLLTLLPRVLSRRPEALAATTGTLHLHCTDAQGEWVLDFGSAPPEVRREHTKADAAVRGPASDLFLWVWNRRPLDGLEVFGRRETAEALAGLKL